MLEKADVALAEGRDMASDEDDDDEMDDPTDNQQTGDEADGASDGSHPPSFDGRFQVAADHPTRTRQRAPARHPNSREKEVSVGQGLTAVANALASGIAVDKLREEVKGLASDMVGLRNDFNSKFDAILAAIQVGNRPTQ